MRRPRDGSRSVFAAVGAAFYLSYAPPTSLVEATETTTATGVSTLVASLLLVALAAVDRVDVTAVVTPRCGPVRRR